MGFKKYRDYSGDKITAEDFMLLVSNFIAIIEAAGFVPDINDKAQMSKAISKLTRKTKFTDSGDSETIRLDYQFSNGISYGEMPDGVTFEFINKFGRTGTPIVNFGGLNPRPLILEDGMELSPNTTVTIVYNKADDNFKVVKYPLKLSDDTKQLLVDYKDLKQQLEDNVIDKITNPPSYSDIESLYTTLQQQINDKFNEFLTVVIPNNQPPTQEEINPIKEYLQTLESDIITLSGISDNIITDFDAIKTEVDTSSPTRLLEINNELIGPNLLFIEEVDFDPIDNSITTDNTDVNRPFLIRWVSDIEASSETPYDFTFIGSFGEMTISFTENMYGGHLYAFVFNGADIVLLKDTDVQSINAVTQVISDLKLKHENEINYIDSVKQTTIKTKLETNKVLEQTQAMLSDTLNEVTSTIAEVLENISVGTTNDDITFEQNEIIGIKFTEEGLSSGTTIGYNPVIVFPDIGLVNQDTTYYIRKVSVSQNDQDRYVWTTELYKGKNFFDHKVSVLTDLGIDSLDIGEDVQQIMEDSNIHQEVDEVDVKNAFKLNEVMTMLSTSHEVKLGEANDILTLLQTKTSDMDSSILNLELVKNRIAKVDRTIDMYIDSINFDTTDLTVIEVGAEGNFISPTDTLDTGCISVTFTTGQNFREGAKVVITDDDNNISKNLLSWVKPELNIEYIYKVVPDSNDYKIVGKRSLMETIIRSLTGHNSLDTLNQDITLLGDKFSIIKNKFDSWSAEFTNVDTTIPNSDELATIEAYNEDWFMGQDIIDHLAEDADYMGEFETELDSVSETATDYHSDISALISDIDNLVSDISNLISTNNDLKSTLDDEFSKLEDLIEIAKTTLKRIEFPFGLGTTSIDIPKIMGYRQSDTDPVLSVSNGYVVGNKTKIESKTGRETITTPNIINSISVDKEVPVIGDSHYSPYALFANRNESILYKYRVPENGHSLSYSATYNWSNTRVIIGKNCDYFEINRKIPLKTNFTIPTDNVTVDGDVLVVDKTGVNTYNSNWNTFIIPSYLDISGTSKINVYEEVSCHADIPNLPKDIHINLFKVNEDPNEFYLAPMSQSVFYGEGYDYATVKTDVKVVGNLDSFNGFIFNINPVSTIDADGTPLDHFLELNSDGFFEVRIYTKGNDAYRSILVNAQGNASTDYHYRDLVLYYDNDNSEWRYRSLTYIKYNPNYRGSNSVIKKNLNPLQGTYYIEPTEDLTVIKDLSLFKDKDYFDSDLVNSKSLDNKLYYGFIEDDIIKVYMYKSESIDNTYVRIVDPYNQYSKQINYLQLISLTEQVTYEVSLTITEKNTINYVYDSTNNELVSSDDTVSLSDNSGLPNWFKIYKESRVKSYRKHGVYEATEFNVDNNTLIVYTRDLDVGELDLISIGFEEYVLNGSDPANLESIEVHYNGDVVTYDISSKTVTHKDLVHIVDGDTTVIEVSANVRVNHYGSTSDSHYCRNQIFNNSYLYKGALRASDDSQILDGLSAQFLTNTIDGFSEELDGLNEFAESVTLDSFLYTKTSGSHFNLRFWYPNTNVSRVATVRLFGNPIWIEEHEAFASSQGTAHGYGNMTAMRLDNGILYTYGD